ncbi:hypothetical protein IMZ48_11730 [Candidatus Bathyarchaeota archaeon]|nr:hypothetical protein [Candidatus Bathyarchaeota archaeon]
MALGLWHSVDFRRGWMPLDLPPLDTSRSSIRLLEVRPAAARWRLETELRTVWLEDNPAYDALSYE